MIGNCFLPLGSRFSKNEEDHKLFLIFSAKLKIKGKRNGKEWCEIIGALYMDW